MFFLLNLYLLEDDFLAVLDVNTAFNGVAYLAALEVVDSTVSCCAIGSNLVDACNTACYVNPACVGFKFLF